MVDKADGEISGLGKIQVMENGDILVTSAILCKQVNTGSSTDLDGDDITKAMFELRNEPGELRFWWHSHVNMGVFWSGTDTDTMQELGQHGYFVSTVFNKKRETRTAIYAAKPYRIFVDEVETLLQRTAEPELEAAWTQEFEAKCETKKYHAPVVVPAIGTDVVSNESQKHTGKGINTLRKVPLLKWPEYVYNGFVYMRDGDAMLIKMYETKYGVDMGDRDIQDLMETMAHEAYGEEHYHGT
jgi:hypothetical protein